MCSGPSNIWFRISDCWILELGSKCIIGITLFSEPVGRFGVFTHTSDLDSAEQTQSHRPWHKDCREHQSPFHPQPLKSLLHWWIPQPKHRLSNTGAC